MADFTEDSGLLVNSQNIRSLILHKEKELHEINDKRVRSLEDAVRTKDKDLQDAKSRLGKLREDFQVAAKFRCERTAVHWPLRNCASTDAPCAHLQYNLKLVEERDAELDRYDGQFALLKQQLRDKDALVSEARVAIADLEQQLKQSQHRYGEQEAYFTVRLRQPVLSPTAPCRHISSQAKLVEMREQQDVLRFSHDDELRRQRDDFESIKARSRAAPAHSLPVSSTPYAAGAAALEAERSRGRAGGAAPRYGPLVRLSQPAGSPTGPTHGRSASVPTISTKDVGRRCRHVRYSSLATVRQRVHVLCISALRRHAKFSPQRVRAHVRAHVRAGVSSRWVDAVQRELEQQRQLEVVRAELRDAETKARQLQARISRQHDAGTKPQ